MRFQEKCNFFKNVLAGDSLSASQGHTPLCRQPEISHVVCSWPIKRKEKEHQMVIILNIDV